MKYCYNCGKAISRKNGDETREHIPAQNLYVDYKDKLKKDLITVPGCLECNQKFSETINSSVRNILAISADNIENNEELINKSLKDVLVINKKRSKNFIFDRFGNPLFEIMGKNPTILFNKKNFKGIFYKEYNLPLIKVLGEEFNISEVSFSFDTKIDINGFYENSIIEKAKSLYTYISSKHQWKISGHEDIFRYLLIKENVNNLETYIGILEYGKKLVSILQAFKLK